MRRAAKLALGLVVLLATLTAGSMSFPWHLIP
jgi:hypothetical protein